MTGYVASPEDLHDLPVGNWHEDQWSCVEQDEFNKGEEHLVLLAPVVGTLSVNHCVDPQVSCSLRLKDHQLRNICENFETKKKH